jgi:cell division protein FtsI/penicillin-binding protein 2
VSSDDPAAGAAGGACWRDRVVYLRDRRLFRLWYLQVLSGERHLVRAGVNRVRELEFTAPRGEILGRSGTVLSDSRAAVAVQVSPPDLPVPLTPSTLTNPP